jgi:alcohol dehydrogenase
MKAARLNAPGTPLVIGQLPEPTLLPGSVRVRVERALVPSFAGAVLSGKLPFPLPVPYTPGPSCIGTIEQVAPDVLGLTPGQRVLCGPHYVAPGNSPEPEEILIGWFGLTPGSAPLMERWKNGAWAQLAVYPVGCVTPVGEGDPERLIGLAPLCISYGGLLRAELRPGQSLLVNGATGHLGSGCVLLALAMGAARVIAVGRNGSVLEELRALAPNRVTTVQVPDDPGGYETAVSRAGVRVDAVVDALGYLPHPSATLAGLHQLRKGGIAVLMGGVLSDIPLSYLQILAQQLTIRGSFMNPASAARDLLGMVRGGLVDLGAIGVQEVPLQEVQAAIGIAAQQRGLRCCALVPAG